MDQTDLNSIAFPKLSDDQLNALDEFATLKTCNDGESLFSAGDSDFGTGLLMGETMESTTRQEFMH